MHIRRALQLFVLGLSAASVAEATFVSPRLARHERALQRRQDDGDDAPPNTASDTPDEPPAPSTSATPTPTPSTSSTPLPPTTSSTPTPPEETSTPITSSTSTTTSPRPGNSVSSTSSSTTAAPEPGESDEPTTHIQTITRTIVTTNPDGQETTVIDEVVTTSTSQPLPNEGGNNKGQSSGMTEQTRNTVIGVVVGVGGAIVLAGLGFVAWRIWGKKKQQEEQDTLMDDYSAVGEKPDTIGSTSTRTPFQSTLESYHAPTQVNTASNF
ncbi:hypothetical protein QBC36DRAFT_40963 [Triangularia setosa]|uniref:Mid2 domain-containing protein n=1 Tax=Triangularia setosa TaxID=2587417 RepID=A0AAN7AAU9_9PEZI|nr:hypothetical protein QBC36DRAFT_40963 [Podospora setosa]